MDWASLGMRVSGGRERNAVVRHTPDSSKYHDVPGANGTMVPAYDSVSASNPHNPAENIVRVVDSVEPANSMDLDISRMTPEISKAVGLAVRAGNFENDMKAIAACYAARELCEGLPRIPRTSTGRIDHELAQEMHVKFAATRRDAAIGPVDALLPAAVAQGGDNAPPAAPAPAPAARSKGLMSSFRGPSPQEPPGQATFARRPAASRHVVFDFGGGDFRVAYDDAIVESVEGCDIRLLILARDDAAGEEGFFPRLGGPPFAVAVEGEDDVHMCEHVGIRFRRGGETTVVLMILKSQPRG